jgi:ribosomal protein S18 acetylase RimI-like enzyme
MMDTNEPKITVRDARADDAETIACYNEAMARETEDLRLDPATIRAGVKAVIDDPGKGKYFVAEVDGRVAGCLLVTYEWSDWRNGTFLWLQSVYVDPEHRRRGVFKALFARVQEIGASQGFCGMRLYVDSHNAGAQKTYDRLGMGFRGYLVFETYDRLREE